MKDKKRKYILMIILLGVLMLLSGCVRKECEEKVKEITGVGSRCIPLEQENLSDKCVCCGKPAKTMVYWGKAY